MRTVDALLARRSTVYAASAVSLALGLVFIFVWTPLPWGWKGIDGYDTISVALAHGEPFPTVHLIWGYAYFLAFFYRLFGEHQAVPLVAQAVLNAGVPIMLYHLVRLHLPERVAVASAALIGLFSFNTVYASTQASDPVCTVLMVAAMLCFALGDRQKRAGYFAASGLLAAAAYQFRPNLVLFPAFLAAAYIVAARWASAPDRRLARNRRITHAAVFVAVFAAGAAPWIVRNYQWTGLFIPASSHGGVQLWFGTLQTGAYRESWLYNPRAAFEYPPIEYTSIDEQPIVVTAMCTAPVHPTVSLVYWTNRDRTPRQTAATIASSGDVLALVPAQPRDTAVYYYFDITAHDHGAERHVDSPPGAPSDPAFVVVSRNHLGDLDVDAHALDVFDIVRMLRHVAWGETLGDSRLDLDRDGVVSEKDIRRAAALLVDPGADPVVPDPVRSLSSNADRATVRFEDHSAITVPRQWSGRITDLELDTPIVTSTAALLMGHSRSFAGLNSAATAPVFATDECTTLTALAANRVPYRRLPHEMRRFTTLAFDNIRHDPVGYLVASAIRAVRVFVIVGSSDQRTAYQFSGAGRMYAIGRVASLAVFVLASVGVWIAWRRGWRVFMLLAPAVYVPLTICFMLINARYSMTVQPFEFAFAAVTLVSALPTRRPSDDLRFSPQWH